MSACVWGGAQAVLSRGQESPEVLESVSGVRARCPKIVQSQVSQCVQPARKYVLGTLQPRVLQKLLCLPDCADASGLKDSDHTRREAGAAVAFPLVWLHEYTNLRNFAWRVHILDQGSCVSCPINLPRQQLIVVKVIPCAFLCNSEGILRPRILGEGGHFQGLTHEKRNFCKPHIDTSAFSLVSNVIVIGEWCLISRRLGLREGGMLLGSRRTSRQWPSC